jgi:hypothetical protein
MNANLPLALLGAAVLVAAGAVAGEGSVLSGRDTPSRGDEPALAVLTTSRGTPLIADSREAAPAAPAPAPAAAPATSRSDSGTIIRSTISAVLVDSSHIVVTGDTAPAHYRYTKDTQFMDEQGRVLSADAVKSGTNATLHYARTNGDLVLTKVIVNGVARPLLGTHTPALTEVQFER